MSEPCSCSDFKELVKNHPKLFARDDSYGLLLCWLELTREDGYTKVHNYGISIRYCPLCGKKLEI